MIKCREKSITRVAISVFLTITVLICPFFSLLQRVNAQDVSGSDGLIYFADDFNRTDRDIHSDNGWYSSYIKDGVARSHTIKDGQLLTEDFSNGGDNASYRPISEATLNQRVCVDIVNLGSMSNHASANIYLRFIPHGSNNTISDSGYKLIVTNTYIAIMRSGNKWDRANLTTGGESVSYYHNYDHQYRVEYCATGSNPTYLSATLYDVTAGNVAVATTIGTDSTSYLQGAGTAALGTTKNGAGMTTAIYDNYIYQQTDIMVAQDNFNREDGQIENDWVASQGTYTNIIPNSVYANKIVSNSVILEPSYNNNLSLVPESAWVRPMSEATLNQSVSADFQSVSVSNTGAISPQGRINSGGVIIARCQGETANANNCYYFIARLGFNGASAWKTDLYLYNTEGAIATATIYRDPSAKYRLELSVTSVSDTESKVTAYFHDVNAEGNITKTITAFDITDDDPNLQQAGTAGFSAYAQYSTVLCVDNFKCLAMPDAIPNITYPDDDVVPMVYSDSFDNENSTIHGTDGWLDQQYLTNGVGIAKIEDGKLIIDNNGVSGTAASFTHKIMRPLSEATLNQRVSVDVLNLNEIDIAEINLRIIEIAIDSAALSRQSFYGLSFSKSVMMFTTKSSWGQGEIAGVEYDCIDGHDYRIVATAQGSLPTVLTATLYDLTDGGKVVATLTARDQTLLTSDYRTAQIPGTVGLCCRSTVPVEFDNFVYEQIDTKIYHDSFNRENGAIGNEWEIGSSAIDSAISSTKLSFSNGGVDNFWDSTLMRPMSEKSVEQYVSVEYSRPDAASNTSAPVVFARAQTDTSIQVEGTSGFACYYAELTYTGDWSSKVSVYKISATGQKTLLGEKPTNIYGKLSTGKSRLILMAQGSNPTKLTVLFCGISEQRNNLFHALTVFDEQPELQSAGTSGMSYSGSTSKFSISKFSYLESQVLPEKPVVPEDLDGDYMAYFTGTVKAGEFGQWVELDPDKVYIYSVRIKRLYNSGGFNPCLRYNPSGWGHMYKTLGVISNTADEENCIEMLEFKAPSDAHKLPNGKVRIKVAIHEGGLSSIGYATDFKVYAKDDPEQNNLLVNPNFKKGMYGWAGSGSYMQGAEEGGIMKSLGKGEVELVNHDDLVFVKDDSDEYFDDGDWSIKFVVDEEVNTTNANINGYLHNSSGKPLSGVTVVLTAENDITVKTNSKGYFIFDNLLPDMYFLSILLKDGTECSFDEILIVSENTDLELELVYDDSESIIEIILPQTPDEQIEEKPTEVQKDNITNKKKVAETDNKLFIILPVILILILVFLACGVIYRKYPKKNR